MLYYNCPKGKAQSTSVTVRESKTCDLGTHNNKSKKNVNFGGFTSFTDQFELRNWVRLKRGAGER